MPLLRDYPWQIKYSPDRANLLQEFYIPALNCAHRYWRTTGYFQATVLALAMRGLLQNCCGKRVSVRSFRS